MSLSIRILICFFIFFSSIRAEENWDQTECFLKKIAFAEPEKWEATLQELKQGSSQSTPREMLDMMAQDILSQNDARIAQLLQKAIRNYNELAQDKAHPFTFCYKHYYPPAFSIPYIDLTLDVQKEKVIVTSHLQIERKTAEGFLSLDGQNHKIHSLSINAAPLAKKSYCVTNNELIILDLPKETSFTVTIVSEIDPFHNMGLEGLYQSGKFLISHCEPEAARQIFYTLDRPDVLSAITTTILADPKNYPVRLSNGNLIEESLLEDGRAKIVWEDPIPKPSYLFAAVLGDFGKVEDTFITQTGRHVSLSAYVEPGKEERALYSLEALKQAMAFDEALFDREYDLNELKIVAVPDFNTGAMENKGLLIFNEKVLLVDSQSATDMRFHQVAAVVAHEYFHNWSGNRVTVRNWFELALKEAFTELRNSLFEEQMFGSALVRPAHVNALKETQFPEEISEKGHSVVVESYVSPYSIYDATTYVKGKEIFRSLKVWLDMVVPDGFRKAQNLYFERHDGTAVTFRELLQAARDILPEEEKQRLSQFERWFVQQGTPLVTVERRYEPAEGKWIFTITQSNPHPKTGRAQEPLLIPFCYEFLSADGTPVLEKQKIILTAPVQTIEITTDQPLIPLFLHDYTAPVLFHFDYSSEELACIMKHATDPFLRWEAGQNYALLALEQVLNGKIDARVFSHYTEALQSPSLPTIAKAQLLQLPSLRTMAQRFDLYDFSKLQSAKDLFQRQLAFQCTSVLKQLLENYPEPSPYAFTVEQIEIRRLRNACWNLLAPIGPAYAERAYDYYLNASSYDTSLSLLKTLVNIPTIAAKATDLFYQTWKEDRLVLNDWLAVQASSLHCTAADVKALMNIKGYEANNPNHINSVLRVFVNNLPRYHDPRGEGYALLVDQILELQKLNPVLAARLASGAFIDFAKVPRSQQVLMEREMNRLQGPDTPDQTRDFIRKTLEKAD